MWVQPPIAAVRSVMGHGRDSSTASAFGEPAQLLSEREIQGCSRDRKTMDGRRNDGESDERAIERMTVDEWNCKNQLAAVFDRL